jgi:hypothetical protein
VYCKDETGTEPFGEWGKDKISLTGFGVTPQNTTVKFSQRQTNGTYKEITKLDLGTFDDSVSSSSPARRKTYNPSMRLLNIPIGTSFPSTAQCVIQLVEVDNDGKLAAELNKWVDEAAKKVKAKLSELLGSTIGNLAAQLVDAVSKAIKEFVAWLIDQLFDNDYFKPYVASVTIPSPEILNTVGARLRSLDQQLVDKKITMATYTNEVQKASAMLPGGRTTATIKGHDGTYEVTYHFGVYFRMGLG